MVLSFVFLVLDLRLPTHGVLTVGAVISLIIGALLFFNSGGPYSGPQVDPWVVYSMAGVIALISFVLITIIVRTQRKPVTTGTEGMIGAQAIALTPLTPEGRVSYGGENWAATLLDASSVDAGAKVLIVSVNGLRLFVRPVRSLPPVEAPAVPKID
jgi:membrane-bound serine protease (ClpP class)